MAEGPAKGPQRKAGPGIAKNGGQTPGNVCEVLLQTKGCRGNDRGGRQRVREVSDQHPASGGTGNSSQYVRAPHRNGGGTAENRNFRTIRAHAARGFLKVVQGFESRCGAGFEG